MTENNLTEENFGPRCDPLNQTAQQNGLVPSFADLQLSVSSLYYIGSIQRRPTFNV